jgi:hypothetical protein
MAMLEAGHAEPERWRVRGRTDQGHGRHAPEEHPALHPVLQSWPRLVLSGRSADCAVVGSVNLDGAWEDPFDVDPRAMSPAARRSARRDSSPADRCTTGNRPRRTRTRTRTPDSPVTRHPRIRTRRSWDPSARNASTSGPRGPWWPCHSRVDRRAPRRRTPADRRRRSTPRGLRPSPGAGAASGWKNRAHSRDLPSRSS